jgi:hypothetical protein
MKMIRHGWIGLAAVGLILWTAHLPAYGQASGGNTGPSGGGGMPSGSATGAGGEGATSGLPPGPGTGPTGQGTEQPAVPPTPGAAGTGTAPGVYPPAGAAPATTQPPSGHTGGPISPNS